jgi:8-oxo-dGTP pyrophosphatase MutT (NUDIX family)
MPRSRGGGRMRYGREPKDPAVEAAVLVPLYRGAADELRLVLVRRNEGRIHGGQLAFPGGKQEAGDRSLLETALREASEEIGIAADAVRVLEQLPVVETMTTAFRITPFLARIVPPDVWVRSEREIAEVLDVPLTEFTKPRARGEENRTFAGLSKPQRVPFYQIGRYKLWGATYRVLHPLIPRLVAGEWPVC